MATTTKWEEVKNSDKVGLINKELWYKIEDELGEISDFEIVDKNDLIEINYKSNGTQKHIYISDRTKKILLQCFLYASIEFKAT